MTTAEIHAANRRDAERALTSVARIEGLLRLGELCIIRHALESIIKRITLALEGYNDQPSI